MKRCFATILIAGLSAACSVQTDPIEGKRGPQGEAGPEGREGPPGPQGDAGLPGKNGQDGAQGDPGPKGNKGDQGLPGGNGQDGAQGDPGPKGDKGDQGLPGTTSWVDDTERVTTHMNVGIGTFSPQASLDVAGTLFEPLEPGQVTVPAGSNMVTGTGTKFLQQLRVGDAIKIGTGVFNIGAIASDTQLTLIESHIAGALNATAFIDSNLLTVRTGSGHQVAAIDKTGNVGIGTTTPTATFDLRGTSATNDVFDEKIGRVNGTTNWVTIFTAAAGAAPQAAAFVEVVTVYGTPSTDTCKVTVMARGALTYSVVQTLGDAVNGCNGISFKWSSATLPSSFQVSANNASIYYAIKANLYSVGAGHKWNHTWGANW